MCFGRLFFPSHALEGLIVGLAIHELSRIFVALCPALSDGIEDLCAILDGTVSVSVTFGWICSHL